MPVSPDGCAEELIVLAGLRPVSRQAAAAILAFAFVIAAGSIDLLVFAGQRCPQS